MSNFTYEDELYHHGIAGMKWGIRRYQNVDGSLTPEGKVRYGVSEGARVYTKRLNKIEKDLTNARYTASDKGKLDFSSESQKAEARKQIAKGEKEINKLIKEAQSKGYKVQSKEVTRVATTGEAIAKNLAFSAGGTVAMQAMGIPVIYLHAQGISSNKYRVGETVA